MPNEIKFYQNIYKTKAGAFVVYQSVYDSIEAAKKSALKQWANDTYVGTIEHKPLNLLK